MGAIRRHSTTAIAEVTEILFHSNTLNNKFVLMISIISHLWRHNGFYDASFDSRLYVYLPYSVHLFLSLIYVISTF